MIFMIHRKVLRYKWIICALICIFTLSKIRFRYLNEPEFIDIPTGDFKFLLLWTRTDFSPFYNLGEGQSAFIKNNCSKSNCYVTSNRKLFNDNLTKFDAIGFNLRHVRNMIKNDLPQQRSPHQKYIVFSYESPVLHPVYSALLDDFFNWTVTYRLDSDIPHPYILVKNNLGVTVGPRIDMKWINNMTNAYDEDLLRKFRGKTKPVAWFASNCQTPGGREDFVDRVQKVLALYDLSVDIYGKCGPLQCDRGANESKCDALLKDYYFYLSLENSFAADYVTEKVLRPLNNDAVPIVYGGADYSRFLPPGSYLQSSSPEELAIEIVRSMQSFKIYSRFFKWKPYYTFSYPHKTESVCSLCAALNNSTMMEQKTVYKDFRNWWSNKYLTRSYTQSYILGHKIIVFMKTLLYYCWLW